MTDPAFLIPLPVLIFGWILAAGSPGPATLAISGTAMQQGRSAATRLALGIVAGSATWGLAAALGFAAVMKANVWLFEVVRYAGATYLLWLAFRSLHSAWRGNKAALPAPASGGHFAKGLLLHLTNPKAILAWGSIYGIALAPQAPWFMVWELFASLIVASILVFMGYSLLFSVAAVATAYARAKRGFEFAFGLLFGAASLSVLTVRLT